MVPHPIGGEPEDVFRVVDANTKWLLTSTLPKLLFHVEPGAIIPPPVADFLKANLTNLETVFLGPGGHFLQEDRGELLAEKIVAWLK